MCSLNRKSPSIMSISRLSDGVFVATSKSFAESLGITPKELCGCSSLSPDLGIWHGPEERELFLSLLKERDEFTDSDIDIRICDYALIFAKVIEIGGEAYLLCVYRDIATRRKEWRGDRTYQEKLRELSSRLFLVEEKERRRISAAIHDYIGQSLALAHLKLQSLEKMPLNGEAKKCLSEANTLVELCLQYSRSITTDLSPSVLYELGLEAAVEWQVDQLQGQFGITYRIKSDGDFPDMDTNIRIFLFRAIRELLANVVKHAKASRVLITLQRRGNRVAITVADNGIGFKQGAARSMKGFGLFNIREYISCIGGVLAIGSRPGQGTIAKISAPVMKRGGKKSSR